MKWKNVIIRKSKMGSYLVEAAVVIPVFVLSVMMFMSAVPILSDAEHTLFSISDEVRFECLKSAIRRNPGMLPLRLNGRIFLEEEDMTRFRVKSYQYLYDNGEIGDLLTVTFRATFQGHDPLGLFDDVTFDGTVTARAFTGKLHRESPQKNGSADDQIVYIFPEWGSRYHGKHCSYVKASCQMVYLSQETKADYNPCKLCEAKSAQIGSPVFCFMESGRVYHLAECRIVDRYYVEIEKQKALTQGYTPCTKCGGS